MERARNGTYVGAVPSSKTGRLLTGPAFRYCGRMPTGALTLGDLRGRLDYLDVACSRCDRRGRYRVDRLIADHGAGKGLPDLAAELASDCPRRENVLRERCQVRFPGLAAQAEQRP